MVFLSGYRRWFQSNGGFDQEDCEREAAIWAVDNEEVGPAGNVQIQRVQSSNSQSKSQNWNYHGIPVRSTNRFV